MKVILKLKEREKPFLPIEAETINPRNFLDPKPDLIIYKGNKELPIDDVFIQTIEGTAENIDEVEIVIRGDSSRIKRVGEYMDGGKITIEGNIGMHCGNFMSAGTIEIHGNADAWLGREMVGGFIKCHGNAGDYCGSGYRGERKGMRGGTIEVLGTAGDFTAETLTGGTVIIHGDSGDLTGVDMHEGTLVIKGDCNRVCGNMDGGSCYVYGTVYEMIPTFRKIGPETVDGVPLTKFTGDIANRGKGTLYIRNYQYMD